MSDTFLYLRFHIIFSTKDRLPLIREEWRDDLYAYLGGILRRERGKLMAINARSDHLHLLSSLRADQSVADMVRLLKTNSSRWIHRERAPGRPFQWQDGYGAFTVSPSAEEKVIRYIAQQESHHRRMNFKEEFLRFLKTHQIQYDERYIWK